MSKHKSVFLGALESTNSLDKLFNLSLDEVRVGLVYLHSDIFNWVLTVELILVLGNHHGWKEDLLEDEWVLVFEHGSSFFILNGCAEKLET